MLTKSKANSWRCQLRHLHTPRHDILHVLIVVALLPAMLLVAARKASTQEEKIFPVTITHALGKTTIAREPQRIVTLGWAGEDIVVALGRIPVGMPKRLFFESGIFPWVEERLGGQRPTLLDSNLTDLEAIAALKPDLILGVMSGINEKDYAQLSRIAPTIAYPGIPWKTHWREHAEIVGRALGQHRHALELIAKTDALIRNLGEKYGNLRGSTFTFSMYSLSGGNIGIYLPSEPRVDLLLQLGMQPSEGVKELAAANPRRIGSGVSIENARTIEADVVAMWVNPGGGEAVMRQPLLRNLDVVRRGSFVLLDDPVSMWASSAPSVLSIQYAYPDIAARLSAAVSHARP